MPFPERHFFSLFQLADRWLLPEEDVRHAVITGQLPVHVWLPRIHADMLLEDEQGRNIILGQTTILQGYCGLFPDDCRLIFRHDGYGIRRWKGLAKNQWHQLHDGMEAIRVEPVDLIILKETVAAIKKGSNPCRIASVVKLRPKTKPSSAAPQKGGFQFLPGFHSVLFAEETFEFGDIQAKIVETLYHAAQTENPWMRGQKLLSMAGSQSFLMRDVFKRHPAWRVLIHSNSRGYYRLSPDAVSSSPHPHPIPI
jgi:hypothetical protein